MHNSNSQFLNWNANATTLAFTLLKLNWNMHASIANHKSRYNARVPLALLFILLGGSLFFVSQIPWFVYVSFKFVSCKVLFDETLRQVSGMNCRYWSVYFCSGMMWCYLIVSLCELMGRVGIFTMQSISFNYVKLNGLLSLLELHLSNLK